MDNFFGKIILGILFLVTTTVVLVIVVWPISMCFSFGRGYSEGERIGRLYKFSYKGVIYKSWEGELALGTVDDKGQANTFGFSVFKNTAEPEKVKALMGKMVKLKYIQWISSGLHYSSSYELVDIQESK